MTGEQPAARTRKSTVFGRILRVTALLEDGMLVILLLAMIGLAVAQIVLRNLFSSGFLWADPAVRVLVLWVGMLGAVVATRDDKQITVDVLSRIVSKRWQDASRVITDLFTAVVSGVVAWHAGRMVVDAYQYPGKPIGIVPVWVCQLVLPVAFAIIALRYLAFAGVHLGRAVRPQQEDE